MNNGPSSAVLNPERATLLELANLRKSIRRAHGSYLYADGGERYLDFTSQYGVHAFGHNPDFLWDEFLAQRDLQMPNMIQPLETAGAIDLARRLIEVAPGRMKHVAFTNSGAECVEVAIKLARAKTRRPKILSTWNGFHGKTMAAAQATGNAFYRESFYLDDPDFVHIPYDDLQALEQCLCSEEYAAFIVEPIQGEGGVVTPSDGYLKGCELLCARYRTLLVVDEIQTGLGRTGSLFACEREGVEPDMVLLSKALGGGFFALGACIANARSWSSDFGMRHSSTFANNHLACRIGLAMLGKLLDEPKWLRTAHETGHYLGQRLTVLAQRYPHVFHSPSGRGLMRGIKLCAWSDEDSYFSVAASHLGLSVPLVASFLMNRHGILTAPTLNSSNTLRLQPNLTITPAEIDVLITALDEVGTLISAGRFADIIGAATTVYPSIARVTPLPPVASSSWKSLLGKPSLKTRLPAVAAEPQLGTFAFFVHPTTDEDLISSMPGGIAAYPPAAIDRLQHWFERYKGLYSQAAPIYYLPCCPSLDGGYVDGWLISSPFTPREMLRLSKQQKQKLLDSYVGVAHSLNADVIGLGAFTSVISRSGEMIANCGIPVTTGNAYTALTSNEGVRQNCLRRGIELAQEQVAIVGARGSVGRLVALDLAAECRHLVLVGNPRNDQALEGLEALAGEICALLLQTREGLASPIGRQLAGAGASAIFAQWLTTAECGLKGYRRLYLAIISRCGAEQAAEFPIRLSTCVEVALKPCRVIITATSNGEAFVKPEHLAAGAIVCDAARPSDLVTSIGELRPDLTVFNGGLARFPAEVRFGRANILGFEAGINLACLAETVALTMARVKRNYSIGGVSSLDEAREVMRLAQRHGFSCHIPSSAPLEVEQKGLDRASCV